MAEPRCPHCEVEGLEHIVSADSHARSKDGMPWFNVVHCDQCGHVYGVLAKAADRSWSSRNGADACPSRLARPSRHSNGTGR